MHSDHVSRTARPADNRASACQLLSALQVHAVQRPDSVALLGADRRLTYYALLAQVDARSRSWGLEAGQRVAVLSCRSVDQVVALLAVLHAGGHYVPLDIEAPASRNQSILDALHPQVLLTDAVQQAQDLNISQGCRIQVLDGEPRALESASLSFGDHDPADPMCILHTSGSTGQPKAVPLSFGNVMSCLDWMQDDYLLSPADVVLHKTPLTFDVAMYELFWPLRCGASVVVAPHGEQRDPVALATRIQMHGVTAVHFVPSMLNAFLECRESGQCSSLRLIFAAGEALPASTVARCRQQLPNAALHNLYGPTEAGVVSRWACDAERDGSSVPIGHCVPGSRMWVLDEHGGAVPKGAEGELYLAGAQLVSGYLNRPELSAERFIEHPHYGRLYRSGDLARQRADGAFEYLGRRDQQVKIRGVRVELGEVEAALLACEGVLEAVAGMHPQAMNAASLVAWIRIDERAGSDAELLRQLRTRLPEVMIPQRLLRLEAFPHLPNGKIHRAALPSPVAARPAGLPAPVAPLTELERQVAAAWSAALGIEDIGVQDRFFDLGGNSLLAIQVLARLRTSLGRQVSVARFFAAPTIAAFCADLSAADSFAPRPDLNAAMPRETDGDDIALVGMACRVPGAAGLEAFWDLLSQGREGIRDLRPDERAALQESLRADASFVARSAEIEQAFAFDAAFFGFTPADAALRDPQHRLLLECAWHAAEHAGLAPGDRRLRTGVYVGLAHDHYHDAVSVPEDDGAFRNLLASDKDYAATTIAHRLDLRGPAVSLQTACSSSGVALHLACQAIRSGDCDAALVGGVRLNPPAHPGYRPVDGGPTSADGRVRPFSADANGMVLSTGVACVVIKRLSQAVADGDHVYAVIKGTAVNNDGAERMAFTAPSQAGQVEVIRAALQHAGVQAQQIGLIEAHGTGTALGDPIEVAALKAAYGDALRIALGSVKGNIGHLDAGAGAIGVIKAALALDRKQLPASLHCERPNPACDFDSTPFFVNPQTQPWAADQPRHAAVSSFGFGGTNFHGILAEGPCLRASASPRSHQVLRLSAHTAEALDALSLRLADHLEAQPTLDLADVAYTLDVGRARLPYRRAIVADSLALAALQLRAATQSIDASGRRPRVAFLFPGQGAQHVQMARSLFECDATFRADLLASEAILEPLIGKSLSAWLYPDAAAEDQAAQALRDTELAQPAIFAVSYALARLWMRWGLRPDALVGHSLGELVAATLSGVFTLEDALKIIASRGQLMQGTPGGGMLAVRMSEAAIQPYLSAEIALAAINAPELIVLSGPREALTLLRQKLDLAEVGTAELHTSHAFHSPMMDAAVPPFERLVDLHPRGRGSIPMVSTVSGQWLQPEDLRDAGYWARQLREPVRFAPAIDCLLSTPGAPWVLLEVGPGQNLCLAARQMLRERGWAYASLPHAAASQQSALAQVLDSVARLFERGIELDPRMFYAGESRLKQALVAYPFARTEFRLPLREAMQAAGAETRQHSASNDVLNPTPSQTEAPAPAANESVQSALLESLARVTGMSFSADQFERSFLELGLDSLSLTQIAGRLRNEFKVPLKFRQLLEDLPNLRALDAYLREHAVSQGSSAPAPAATAVATAAASPAGGAAPAVPASFGAGARIERRRGDALSQPQAAALEALSQRYLARTGRSRAFAQQHRAQLADPRTVSGFRPGIKELVYPIVVDRSEGAWMWDLDGNRYVDATCGFGSVFFGHKPEFVATALRDQLERGWEIGPQTPLAGACAQLFTQATQQDRVAFCNTGSEAVIAAVRLARTVTGKSVVVSFAGDYHGIQDEVLVRAGADGRSIPAAPGIPGESVANTLILEYGSPRSLEIIRQRADDIAAILVEPVQSRRPDFQPQAFIQELRALTEQSDIALIMDEVITGFRSGLRGAQGFYGVEADIATYGKVFGGGLPIGAVAGKARFLDALDGGQWQYGDDSIPEVGVTYFAGTFVRHPLVLASVHACLTQLIAHPEWPQQLAEKTRRMTDRLNEEFHRRGAPLHIARYSSLWKPAWDCEQPHGDLLFFLLREQGIHIWEGRPCFLTMAHSDADCEQIIDAFRHALTELERGGFLEARVSAPALPQGWRYREAPPVAGARIGRDAAGNPAWFVPDTSRPGRYRQLEHAA
jgi:amino acid adenylation domain-containing protein